MKNSLTLLAVCLFSLMSFAQSNQLVWNNGRMQYAAPVANIDSITFPGNVLASDTLHFILPRSQEKYIYDTITVEKHDTVYKTVTVVQKDTVYLPVYVDTLYLPVYIDLTKEYALAGAFSVAANHQVYFSRGNLQYSIASDKFSFAKNQYDVIGTANVDGDTLNYYKIDLFGWSTNNPATPWGVSTSAETEDYSGNFVDWGKNIGDGTTWRTLTKNEWDFLFNTRTNANQLYGFATVDGTTGLVLLPDAWTLPSGITFNAGTGAYANNTYTLEQWAKMESAGAVFLPAAGKRGRTSVDDVQTEGQYWSSTLTDYTTSAYKCRFLPYATSDIVQHGLDGIRLWVSGSVRLVQDL